MFCLLISTIYQIQKSGILYADLVNSNLSIPRLGIILMYVYTNQESTSSFYISLSKKIKGKWCSGRAVPQLRLMLNSLLSKCTGPACRMHGLPFDQ